MTDLFALAEKQMEAQAVRLGIPISRRYSDNELAIAMEVLAEAEQQIYGSPLLPFRVTVTVDGKAEQINMIERDSCSAIANALELAFADCSKPGAFKVKVEPLHVAELKVAA